MALLPILEFPDPRLRTKAALVEAAEVTTPAFQQLLDDMLQTMYDAPGIGLAASQVDVHKRFMVIDVSEEHNEPQVFINPQIISASEGGRVYQVKRVYEGIIPNMERRYRETDSAWSREEMERYQSNRACGACGAAGGCCLRDLQCRPL